MAESGLGATVRRIGTVASALVGANNSVAYRVGSTCEIEEMLWMNEDPVRCQAYLARHFRHDPLAPTHCLQRPDRIVCLHDSLAGSAAAWRYREGFMRPYRLCDAIEMFLPVPRTGALYGFSLLRNAPNPGFSAADLAALAEFHGLASQLLEALCDEERDGRGRLARSFPTLTERELDVALAIAEGLSNKAVMRREGMALSTVKTHLQNIFRKCGVASRAELIRLAN